MVEALAVVVIIVVGSLDAGGIAACRRGFVGSVGLVVLVGLVY